MKGLVKSTVSLARTESGGSNRMCFAVACKTMLARTLGMRITRAVIFSASISAMLSVSLGALATGNNIAQASAKHLKELYAAAGGDLIDIKVADMKIERDGRICYAMKTGGDFLHTPDGGPLVELHTELRCPGRAPFTEVTRFRLAEIASYRDLDKAYPHLCEVRCAQGKPCISWAAPTMTFAFSLLAFRTPAVCATFATMIVGVGRARKDTRAGFGSL